MLIGSLCKSCMVVHPHFRTSSHVWICLLEAAAIFPTTLGVATWHVLPSGKECALFLGQNFKEAHVSSHLLSGKKLPAVLRGHWTLALNNHIVPCHLPSRKPTLDHLSSHHYPYWHKSFLFKIYDYVFSAFLLSCFSFIYCIVGRLNRI